MLLIQHNGKSEIALLAMLLLEFLCIPAGTAILARQSRMRRPVETRMPLALGHSAPPPHPLPINSGGAVRIRGTHCR